MTQKPQIKSLNDVLLLLPALYSEASYKVYRAAFVKITRLTGEPLTRIAADENVWFDRSRSIVWAGAFGNGAPGVQQANFQAWVKKIAAAIRRARHYVASPVSASCHDAAWNRLEAYAKDVQSTYDDEGVLLLPNLSSVSIANLRARCRNTCPL